MHRCRCRCMTRRSSNAPVGPVSAPRISEAEPRHPRWQQVERLATELARSHRWALVREVSPIESDTETAPRVAEVGVQHCIATDESCVLLVEITPAYISRDRSCVDAPLWRVQQAGGREDVG